MNDIPRDTPRANLIDSLVAPTHWQDITPSTNLQSYVHCSIVVANSRLDDELSVAIIEFTTTPDWLKRANMDPYGFPKKTAFGTIWRGIDPNEQDLLGQTPFMRTIMKGGLSLLEAEMMAEFDDTDVNIQDNNGRTALHWACVGDHVDLVRLCLSVPECLIGLKDNNGYTAFDVSLTGPNEIIPTLFYKSMFDLQETHPQAALLRSLTVTSEPTPGRTIFPGSAIFQPIADRNHPLVQALIERGIDLTARNRFGQTALHVAAQMGNVEAATMLLDAGSDLNEIGSEGATPSTQDVRTANTNLVQMLLDWDAEIVIKHTVDTSAMDWESDNEKLELEQLLINARTAGEREETVPPFMDMTEESAIDCAAENQPPGAEQVFFVHTGGVGKREGTEPPVIDMTEHSAMDWEADNEKSGVEQPLLVHAGAASERELTVPPVMDMMEQSGVEAPLLVHAGAAGERERTVPPAMDVTEQSGVDQPLLVHTVAAGERERTAPQLVAVAEEGLLGSEISETESDSQGQTPLIKAVRNGKLDTVQRLSKRGRKMNSKDLDGFNALHYAAQIGSSAMITALLEGGAGIECCSVYGLTALHLATRGGHLPAVNVLLAAGADVGSAGGLRSAPLHLAASFGRPLIVNCLLAGGAQIESVNNFGERALHLAANKGHTNIVKTLLASGAMIEAETTLGERALHLAAKWGYTRVVIILLAAGANLEATCTSGNTALNLASKSMHEATVKALVARGAK